MNPQFRSRNWIAALAAALVYGSLASSAFAAGVRNDVDRRFELAQAGAEITAGYLIGLRLKDGSARAALHKMLAQEFRCGLVTDLNFIAPMFRCFKDHAKLHPVCDDVSVMIMPKWSDPKAEPAALLKQLDAVPITGGEAYCDEPMFQSKTAVDWFKARQTQAEGALRNVLDAFHLPGMKASEAFDMLVREGFACGVANVPAAKDAAAIERGFMCMKAASRIEGCYHQRAELRLSWPYPRAAIQDLIAQLPTAKVRSVESSCTLPPIEPSEPAHI